jgi:hypothetical protein
MHRREAANGEAAGITYVDPRNAARAARTPYAVAPTNTGDPPAAGYAHT